MPIFGINVTSRNGAIVHEELRRARVGFANVRLTSGLRSDARGEWNLENFRKNGIPTGVIHELTAKELTEAVIEADYFADELTKFYNKPELYTICKLESQNELDEKLIAAIVSTFMERLNRRIEGLDLCVMGRLSQLRALDESLKKSGAEPIFAYWCVDEPEKLRDRFNYYNDRTNREESELEFAGWQFREFGAIEGCKGAFEQNFGYEGLAELILNAKCGEIAGQFIEFARENCQELVMKLANRVSTNRLSATPQPLRLLSYEKQLLVVRWQCGLTPEETNLLNKFRGAPEIVNQVCRCVLDLA